MNKKNAFSYLMWFVYTMAVCFGLLYIAGILSRQAGYSVAVGYGVSGLWIILCGLLVFLLYKLVRKICNTGAFGRMPALVLESLIVLIVFAVGIFLRINGLANAGEDAAYYELTKVAEGQTIPTVVHGAVYIYLHLLHMVYQIFGNRFLAGIWLQIILQMIAGIFCYRAVRKAAGVPASLVTLGFIIIGPLMVSESLALSPEMLFLAIFALVLYVSIRCISGNKGMVMCLITGLLIAVVCYLDIMGVALLLMTIVGLLLKRNEVDRSLPSRVISSLFCILGCVVGFLLLILVDSQISTKEFLNVIGAWWELYRPAAFAVPATFDLTTLGFDSLLLLLVMVPGSFSFWCDFEKERQSIWIVIAIAFVLLQFFGMTTTELNGYQNLYIIFAVLAGAGIGNICVFKEEDINWSYIEKVANAGEIPSVEFVDEQNAEEADPAVEEVSEAAEEQPKVKLLENPLPLPKKHVKKVLDYDYEFDIELDEFDIVVDDNDDFDI